MAERWRRIEIAACGIGILLGGLAQSSPESAPPDTVHWKASIGGGRPLDAGAAATVELEATIDAGWHVYGLKQPKGGPIPLRVQLDRNEAAVAAGAARESPPQKIHDPRFGLETEFHTNALTVRLPVRLSAQAAGSIALPLAVRFQLCSEQECEPPRTVHLEVPVEVAAGRAASIDGRWDAELITQAGTVIPFRLDLSGSAGNLKGTLYDGFRPYEGTTSASFEDGKLVLDIEHYLTTITATVQDGRLVGAVARGGTRQYGFQAARHVEVRAATPSAAPRVAGSWIVPLPVSSAKGERAVRFIVEQHGAEIAASILRVDGDTGSYAGSYRDGKWVLSHFDGSRPGVITVIPKADGTLEIEQHPDRPAGAADGEAVATKLVAYRPDVALARGLPQPENTETHTTARDPHAKFTFSFPDDHGRLVTNEDPRFQGKVVLAIVTGTWCPNCHDEAQYLVQLDRRFRDQGLAIVALDFEEPDQQGSLERERAFVRQYGVQYTYLIAGAPTEIREKIPQLVNLTTWPATVFIGRDGTVRGVHAGFASPATGEFHAQLEKEFTSRIEALLAEKPAADAKPAD